MNARVRACWQETAEIGAIEQTVPAGHKTLRRRLAGPEDGCSAVNGASAAAAIARPAGLGVRAENVLKELALELTGETPPKGRWIPPHKLLRKLTFKHLLTARNCGPQTTDEIVRWAESRGVVIQRPLHAGKSLSVIWRDLVVKCSNGEFTKAEIAEALERSARRRNTRIPVAFQNILLQILSSAHE